MEDKKRIVEHLNEPQRSYLIRIEKEISYVVIENIYYLENGECGKMWTRKTPNTDIFYEVIIQIWLLHNEINPEYRL